MNNDEVPGIVPTLIEAPPIFQKDWKSATQWPIGIGHVAANVGDEIYLWSGVQRQPNLAWLDLPVDVIWVYRPETNSWRTIEATGDIPPPTFNSAYAVLENVIYIFGGLRKPVTEGPTNNLYSLSSSGNFKLIRPVGKLPSPRRGFRGWAYEGALFFHGGGSRKHVHDKSAFIEGGDFIISDHKSFETNNQVVKYDPVANAWSYVETNGAWEQPRYHYAFASANEKQFMHGGWGKEGRVDDLMIFDERKKKWDAVPAKGDVPKALTAHAMFASTPTKMVLVGGFYGPGTADWNDKPPEKGDGLSKAVWSFDAIEEKWKKEADLPASFYGNEDGLCCDQAVEVNKRTYLVGGCVDWYEKHHSRYILKF